MNIQIRDAINGWVLVYHPTDFTVGVVDEYVCVSVADVLRRTKELLSSHLSRCSLVKSDQSPPSPPAESGSLGEDSKSCSSEPAEPSPPRQKREGKTTELDVTCQVPSPLLDLELYRKDMKLVNAWGSLYPAWKKAHPALDVDAEIAKAHAWEMANPKNRKKQRARFLGNWLGRAQDRAPRVDGGGTSFQGRVKGNFVEHDPYYAAQKKSREAALKEDPFKDTEVPF